MMIQVSFASASRMLESSTLIWIASRLKPSICKPRVWPLSRSIVAKRSVLSTAASGFCRSDLMRNLSETPSHLDVSLMESLTQNYRLNGVRGKNAVFVLGPMGVGKSTFIEHCLRTHSCYKSHILVDTDDLMCSMSNYDPEKVQTSYSFAREISKFLTDWLMENRFNFIAEGTAVKWEELLQYMVCLKERDYTIDVVMLNSDLDTVLRQAECRSRKIPEDVVRSIFVDSKKGCDNLLNENEKLKLFSVKEPEQCLYTVSS